MEKDLVHIQAEKVSLEGSLKIPKGAKGIVLFAHGSGSSRHSPRNQFVAKFLQEGGVATLLIDLLTQDEEREDSVTGELRFDIALLARRLVAVTDWLQKNSQTRELDIGYFGASTGAAAALVAAVEKASLISAVVSRGGRPDMAGSILHLVKAPTLLIVGERDREVIGMNEAAFDKLKCEKKLAIVPNATHLFEEPGALEAVAKLARAWFSTHLGARA
ncbi:MAG: dienelactone hydrolase family protein [Chlamydiales bacterium]|nr:dienelactone hydrolase family protein [Chlamydiales bacterium]